jgi:hypothetical protein
MDRQNSIGDGKTARTPGSSKCFCRIAQLQLRTREEQRADALHQETTKVKQVEQDSSDGPAAI